MNSKKDTQKTSLNSYGQRNVLDIKSLDNGLVYEFANKKTEKLVTALYMVTDCMDTDDALKSKIRQLSVELLSHIYKLSLLSPIEKHIHIDASLSRINEIISFVEIANMVGFISDMNTSILTKEFQILVSELGSYKEKDKRFTFTLNEDMFSVDETPNMSENNPYYNDKKNHVKDNLFKRTPYSTMSFIKQKENNNVLNVRNNYTNNNHSDILSDRKERVDKIVSIIKNISSETNRDVSIKDIASEINNCSEKTIQRDLNSLVSLGKITKSGNKRWSRYKLVSSD